MKKIEMISINGEKIHLKKDNLGWRIVNPIKNEDGSINIINLLFGGKRNLAILLIILLFVLGFFYVYHHDTAEMRKVVENPCLYCRSSINLTNLNMETLDMKILKENE
jgi:hypothetical protein